MPLYKPSELRQFLDQVGTGPKKGLSQNFLIDGNILRRIVSTAHVVPGDVVLEIGPGPGALTEELLKAGAHVIAVEKDSLFARELPRLKGEGDSLEVFCEDILKFPIASSLQSRLQPGQKAKVIANLPYHLTTPIIASLIKMRELLSSCVVMVQEEVARRFVAKPGTRDYSSMTLFLHFYAEPLYAFTVTRRCFYPAPKVDSAIVAIHLRKPPHVSNEEAFFVLVRTAFQQRRKMLRGALRSLYPATSVESALQMINREVTTRPEELSLQEFIALFEAVQKIKEGS